MQDLPYNGGILLRRCWAGIRKWLRTNSTIPYFSDDLFGSEQNERTKSSEDDAGKGKGDYFAKVSILAKIVSEKYKKVI